MQGGEGSLTAGISTEDTWDSHNGGAPPGENVAQYAIQGAAIRTAVMSKEQLMGGRVCSFWAGCPKGLLRPV